MCRSFLGALLPQWHLSQPMTDGAAPMEKRLVWLRLLRQLLALDAAAVLRPAQQSSAFILNSYLSILNSRLVFSGATRTWPGLRRILYDCLKHEMDGNTHAGLNAYVLQFMTLK